MTLSAFHALPLAIALGASCGGPSRGVPDATPVFPGDTVMIGAGDIAACDVETDDATAKLLDRFSAATVFTVGDNAYPSGTLDEYERCYAPNWGRHKARTRPVAGNHEYKDGKGEGYFAYWGAAAGTPGEGWYSFDEGAWHVVVLNSNCAAVGGCSADSPQVKWLEGDLAASRARCTMAIWHHPRWGSGRPDPSVQTFWDVLYTHDADLVISAHDHFYERTAPVNPLGEPDAARGIRQIIAGTGGRSLYEFEKPAPATTEVRDAKTYGVLALGLSPTGYTWAFVPAAGGTFTDRGTGVCH